MGSFTRAEFQTPKGRRRKRKRKRMRKRKRKGRKPKHWAVITSRRYYPPFPIPTDEFRGKTNCFQETPSKYMRYCSNYMQSLDRSSVSHTGHAAVRQKLDSNHLTRVSREPLFHLHSEGGLHQISLNAEGYHTINKIIPYIP